MAKAIKNIIFNAPIEKVYQVVTDFEKYSEFVPETTEVIVHKKTKSSAEATFKIKVMKEVSYTLKISLKEPTRVSWSLIKGDFMKSNDGSWTLKKIDKNTTEAVYELEVGLGLLVPGAVSKALINSSLPKMMDAFKKRIES